MKNYDAASDYQTLAGIVATVSGVMPVLRALKAAGISPNRIGTANLMSLEVARAIETARAELGLPKLGR